MLYEALIKKRLIILVIWLVFILLLIPLTMNYSNYVNYGNASSSATSESQTVQNILANTSTQNSSLYVIVISNPYNISMANKTLDFQNSISNDKIKNFSSSSSPYSEYASFLDQVLGNKKAQISSLYLNFTDYATFIMQFPASFYRNYTLNENTMVIAEKSGYNNSKYESLFLSNFNSTNNMSLTQRINIAVTNTISEYYTQNNSLFYAFSVLKYVNVTVFPSDLLNAGAQFISNLTGQNISPSIVYTSTLKGDFGINYIEHFGLSGIPSFISERYINSNSTAFLIFINFNVRQGYISPSGFYPASAATPTLIPAVKQYFGSAGYLTGNGAINYQTQQQTSQSGAFFGAIFIILFIAVFLTLYSYKLSLLNLALVSITVVIGYLAIVISGLIFGKVSYIVTYTLTAVLLGITTDYVVFVVYRYRSELRRGKGREFILKEPIKNSVKTVLISGVTVAVSLGMFAFIGNFETWGTVLFLSIIITVVMVVTTMPAILSYITPKFFMKKGLKKETEIDIAFSYFYKASKLSTEKSAIVILVILVLAIPSILFFVTIPTTYDFNAGLSQDLSSVQGLNHLDSYFGESVLYPTYVLVPLPNHNVSSLQDQNILISSAKHLLSCKGTKEVVGPYSNGTAISSNTTISQFLTYDNKYAFFIVYTNYNPYSSQAISYTQTLRDNKTLLVGGLTSSVIDQQAQNNRDFTELAILISVAVFAVLAVSFRNIKYPIISLSGVFISISWALSILYLISTYLLHEAIIYLIPVILFVILMSLGNDYSVFIISRVREEQARYGNVEGINRGLQSSGKIVTSLGLILAGSLGALGLIPASFLEQMGIAFVVSLVIDTFVIRVFYFPAMMKVLKANFKRG